jgi:hypothetical protein
MQRSKGSSSGVVWLEKEGGGPLLNYKDWV